MSCTAVEQRIRCGATRPSGAGLESDGPGRTDATDRELSFTATGPIELESEARRLFAAVADATCDNRALSGEWQDQIWAAFGDESAPTPALPNGVSWGASRQNLGDVLVWTLSLTW